MTYSILVDDDYPKVPCPLDDALLSAQFRRYQKTLLEDSENDYGHSD